MLQLPLAHVMSYLLHVALTLAAQDLKRRIRKIPGVPIMCPPFSLRFNAPPHRTETRFTHLHPLS
jgi:hypothetical protein